MRCKYNITNNGSTIEFNGITEKKTALFGGYKNVTYTKESSMMQMSNSIPNTSNPISFNVKLNDIGVNKLGNDNHGIEVGFAKKIADTKHKLKRSKRMEIGLWYDPFNGGIYNHKTLPVEFVDRAEGDDVIEWKIQGIENKNNVVRSKFTLLLNNEDTGHSFVLNNPADLFPTIYIGSSSAKITLDITGMGYLPTVIEFPEKPFNDRGWIKGKFNFSFITFLSK